MIPCDACTEGPIYKVMLMSLEKVFEFMKAWCPTQHHVKPHNAMNGSEVLMKQGWELKVQHTNFF